jgi:sortase A
MGTSDLDQRPAPYAEHELGKDLFVEREWDSRFRRLSRLGRGIRSRAWLRRTLRGLLVLMFLVGLGLFSFPFATNVFADHRQGQLQREFVAPDTRKAYVEGTTKVGQALTRIQIPRLGVDSIVVQGTSLSVLRAGVGHYEGTGLPCERGNAAIAGHRSTYSKPFARVDDLAVGDQIVLTTPVDRCVYAVTRTAWITEPDDGSVLRELPGNYLTLTTCHPPGSAEERLIVRARMVFSEPLGS